MTAVNNAIVDPDTGVMCELSRSSHVPTPGALLYFMGAFVTGAIRSIGAGLCGRKGNPAGRYAEGGTGLATVYIAISSVLLLRFPFRYRAEGILW